MIVTHLTMKEINQKIIEWRKSIIKLRKKEKDIKNKIMNLLKIKRLKKKVKLKKRMNSKKAMKIEKKKMKKKVM